MDRTTTIGTGTLNAFGMATFTTSTLSVGVHTITAVYNGDGNFTGSTSAQLFQVVQTNSTLIHSSAKSTVPAHAKPVFPKTTIGFVGISSDSNRSPEIAASSRPTSVPAQSLSKSNLNLSIVDDFFSAFGRGEETTFMSAASRLKKALNQVLSSLLGL
jgi:hypothetical protein